jgi:predicted acetyltransferase
MFGYEISCTRFNISIPTKQFSIKPSGEFVLILPGDDTSMLAEVHSAYIADLNQGICRDYWPDNRAWKMFTREDPCASGTFIYLWKDENGKPLSYIKYRDAIEDGKHSMSVTELAYTCKKGLYGVLGLINGLSSQYNNFNWLMPAHIDPFDFTGDAWSISQKINPRDMSRVVNVKEALSKMRRPSGESEYIIEVTDETIMANNGRYLVEYGPEGTKVSATQKSAQLSCDIRVLSQLVIGYRTLENALLTRRQGLELTGNQETLNRVFTLRPQHVTEYF